MPFLTQGNTNWKFLLIVIVLTVIVGAGILFWSKPEEVSPPEFPSEEVEKVIIATDKSKYDRGETIEITIRNNLDGPIFGGYSRDIISDWGIEKFENEQWEDIDFWLLPLRANDKEDCSAFFPEMPIGVRKIESYSKIIQKWNQKYCSRKEESLLLDKGRYRLIFVYGLGAGNFAYGSKFYHTPLENSRVIYSNEFTIKEGILLKNCNDFNPPMTPEEIKECICPTGYVKFYGLDWAYCATDSQKTCESQEDCPMDERCISEDGTRWFCSGRKTGCYIWDPGMEEKICAD